MTGTFGEFEVQVERKEIETLESARFEILKKKLEAVGIDCDTCMVGEYNRLICQEVMYDKYSKRSRRFAFVAMKTVEDANAAVEKLNGTEIGGQTIKVNITEKPLSTVDTSLLQAEESEFVDSPYKVYVGNLAKTMTLDMLSKFFSEKGKVLGARISRVLGTSKPSGFGFVSFSSDEDVEASISSLNNVLYNI